MSTSQYREHPSGGSDSSDEGEHETLLMGQDGHRKEDVEERKRRQAEISELSSLDRPYVRPTGTGADTRVSVATSGVGSSSTKPRVHGAGASSTISSPELLAAGGQRGTGPLYTEVVAGGGVGVSVVRPKLLPEFPEMDKIPSKLVPASASTPYVQSVFVPRLKKSPVVDSTGKPRMAAKLGGLTGITELSKSKRESSGVGQSVVTEMGQSGKEAASVVVTQVAPMVQEDDPMEMISPVTIAPVMNAPVGNAPGESNPIGPSVASGGDGVSEGTGHVSEADQSMDTQGSAEDMRLARLERAQSTLLSKPAIVEAYEAPWKGRPAESWKPNLIPTWRAQKKADFEAAWKLAEPWIQGRGHLQYPILRDSVTEPVANLPWEGFQNRRVLALSAAFAQSDFRCPVKGCEVEMRGATDQYDSPQATHRAVVMHRGMQGDE